MSTWLALPSKRRPDEVEKVLSVWRSMGYRIAVRRDHGDSYMETKPDLLTVGEESGYPGYAVSMNHLCRQILNADSSAEWIVAAGDDTLPDPNKRADEIAADYSRYFGVMNNSYWGNLWKGCPVDTFGVMQPTGDPWFDSIGRIIDRIAGSPWIGREFARRMYHGAGPYWHEYRHCFVDEELQCVAQKLGVFWQRPDLTHHHENWARAHAGRPQDMPEFLREANSPEHWAKYSAIFKARKEAGFPGHEPIA